MNVWRYFFGEEDAHGCAHQTHRDVVHSAKNAMQESIAEARNFGKQSQNAKLTAENAVRELEAIRDKMRDEKN